jgi:hypothetical protein
MHPVTNNYHVCEMDNDTRPSNMLSIFSKSITAVFYILYPRRESSVVLFSFPDLYKVLCNKDAVCGCMLPAGQSGRTGCIHTKQGPSLIMHSCGEHGNNYTRYRFAAGRKSVDSRAECTHVAPAGSGSPVGFSQTTQSFASLGCLF